MSHRCIIAGLKLTTANILYAPVNLCLQKAQKQNGIGLIVLVLCVQDVMARYKETGHKNWKDFPSKACFQMNDTHPTIAVAELMRLLIDQEGLDWEEAWSITTQVILHLITSTKALITRTCVHPMSHLDAINAQMRFCLNSTV